MQKKLSGGVPLPEKRDVGVGPAWRGAAPAPAPGSAGRGRAGPATGDPARRVAPRHTQSEQKFKFNFQNTPFFHGGGGGAGVPFLLFLYLTI